MKRRTFIAGLGSAVAMPVVARAQQMPVVGFLYPGSPEPIPHLLAALRKGLSEVGYTEGRNVVIEYRYAHNDVDRLQELAADLVRGRVAVIVSGGAAAALAAKAQTTTIPIVFGDGADPTQNGLVASFNQPGGNVTGFAGMFGELGAKRVGLLHELLPKAVRFGALLYPDTSTLESENVKVAASAIGRQLEVFTAGTNRAIDTAFASLAKRQIDALLVGQAVIFNNRRVQLTTLAAHHHLPVVYPFREFVDAGGLMSYGSSLADQFRQIGIYAGRILKGVKPSDLPVMRPTRFEFVINMQTARTLGLNVPATLLALADQVIE